MNISIRHADIADLKIVCALGAATFYEAYCLQDDSNDLATYVLENFSLEQIEMELTDANSMFLIAEVNACAIGYAKLRENSLAECLNGTNAVEIQRVYLLEKLRGKGVGKAIMERCFTEARRKNYEAVWLGVWERNLEARKFYQKYGFTKVGELTFPYGETVGINHVLKLDLI